MQIAFFLHTFPTISETFIRNQITGLIDLGHTVTIFCLPNPDEKAWEIEDVKKYHLRDYVVDRNISIPKGKWKRFVEAIKIIGNHWHTNKKQICQALNVFKYGKKALDLTLIHTIAPYLGKPYEILQCHFGHIANQAVILKELKFEFKMQVMFHGFDIRHGIEKGGNVYNGLIKYADKIQSISKYNYKHLVEFGFPKDKIVFHPVGIDLNKFTQKTNYNTTDTIQILSVGRLVWEKGYKYGIEAIAKLIYEFDYKINYRIVGAGVLLNELKELSKKLNIEEHIEFVGAKEQNEISKLMQQSDIFFLPSEAEALPVVLMEAMACGLPVIATNVGSVIELVIEDQNGFIAQTKNVKSITEKLHALIGEKENWKKIGTYGRRHIESHYNILQLNKSLLE